MEVHSQRVPEVTSLGENPTGISTLIHLPSASHISSLVGTIVTFQVGPPDQLPFNHTFRGVSLNLTDVDNLTSRILKICWIF